MDVEDVGLLSATSLNENGQEQAGMGVSAADFNRDGRLDIVKTNFSDDVPSLYRNEGKGFFTDVSYRAGLGVHTNYLGWGVSFVDVDHDGSKDIFIVNSHVYPSIDELKSASPYRQKRLVHWNVRNGAFIDVSPQAGSGVSTPASARGAAFSDLDNDGAIEVVINNLDSTPNLLRNRAETDASHSLTIATDSSWFFPFQLNGPASLGKPVGRVDLAMPYTAPQCVSKRLRSLQPSQPKPCARWGSSLCRWRFYSWQPGRLKPRTLSMN